MAKTGEDALDQLINHRFADQPRGTPNQPYANYSFSVVVRCAAINLIPKLQKTLLSTSNLRFCGVKLVDYGRQDTVGGHEGEYVCFLFALEAKVNSMDQSFFEESREQSAIKARIIAKYFWAWAKVIIPTAKTHDNRIAYIDLFAGPGRYRDGTISTPLRVLEQAIADPDMSQMLVTLFNDKNSENVGELETAIGQLPGIERLKYKPQIVNQEVGTEIVQLFSKMTMVPTFFFVDPWGYKGLSLGLINSVLKNWGCDCVFFFNYNRVNMGLPNEFVRDHMDVLFGVERAERVRELLDGLSPEERESLIVEQLSEALREMGGRFVLPFTFRNEAGSRTTHHLIYVSKAFRGYEIMKGIMAQESSEADQGVPSFQYSPASAKFPLLFDLTTPLEDLGEELLRRFAGRILTMYEIYMEHNVGRPFISRNYKRILNNLEEAGKIMAAPPAKDRRMQKGERTFADQVRVTFPKEVK